MKQKKTTQQTKNKIAMKTNPPNTSHTCSLCHRTLPTEAFYLVNKHTGKHDAYCKECRRQRNKLGRQAADTTAEPPRRRLSICEEPDPERRLQLIRQACRTVRDSVMRKRKRDAEEEDERTSACSGE